jgi:hypothetical protein|tara:strand:- start:4731 stop:5342 length:612 start_codon:yes stop_codon:yes gene_type:complete
MTIQKIRTTGYVCSPYLHDHNSIEQKDLWMGSKNIGDMYFVTATFSENSQPYFSYATNHYILAQFKNHQKISTEMSKNLLEKPSFIFKIDDLLFERQALGKPNFISIYYLEYGDSHEDQIDVATHVARRDKVGYTGFGHMELFSSVTPKFTFPYSNNIVIMEVSSEKSHQSDNKYCEQTRLDICRKGIVMNNLVSFSLLEKLK